MAISVASITTMTVTMATVVASGRDRPVVVNRFDYPSMENGPGVSVTYNRHMDNFMFDNRPVTDVQINYWAMVVAVVDSIAVSEASMAITVASIAVAMTTVTSVMSTMMTVVILITRAGVRISSRVCSSR